MMQTKNKIKKTRLVKGRTMEGPHYYVTYQVYTEDGRCIKRAIRCRDKEHQLQVHAEISKIRSCYRWRLLNCTVPKDDVEIFDPIKHLSNNSLKE